MTLRQRFNETLNELPNILCDLEKSVSEQNWTKEKSNIAVNMIETLRDNCSVGIMTGCCTSNSQITFSTFNLIICPSDCGMNENDLFEPVKLTNYISDLVEDLNNISDTIKFKIGLRRASIFQFEWEF